MRLVTLHDGLFSVVLKNISISTTFLKKTLKLCKTRVNAKGCFHLRHKTLVLKLKSKAPS